MGFQTHDDMNGNYLKVSDIFLEKGDYLRLKNITLGYTLPKHISRHIGMEKGSVRVYLSIDNVATITGYSGWQGKKLRMGVSGNMEYSAYLELGHEGRFAILWATVQANEQKIMDDLRKVVR